MINSISLVDLIRQKWSLTINQGYIDYASLLCLSEDIIIKVKKKWHVNRNALLKQVDVMKYVLITRSRLDFAWDARGDEMFFIDQKTFPFPDKCSSKSFPISTEKWLVS